MLAEVLQSEGSHEMEFDGVYQIMVFTLYRSANWTCPKCGEITLCFLVLCCSFNAFHILIPTYEFKKTESWFLMLALRLWQCVLAVANRTCV